MNGVPHQFVHSLFFSSSVSLDLSLSGTQSSTSAPRLISCEKRGGWGLTDDGVEESEDEALAGDVEYKVEREVVLVLDDQVRVAVGRSRAWIHLSAGYERRSRDVGRRNGPGVLRSGATKELSNPRQSGEADAARRKGTKSARALSEPERSRNERAHRVTEPKSVPPSTMLSISSLA